VEEFAIGRGIGLPAGPLPAGLAITLFGPAFPDTNGYAARFIVVAVSVLGTLPLLPKLQSGETEREGLAD
jgi:hypothetical protein